MVHDHVEDSARLSQGVTVTSYASQSKGPDQMLCSAPVRSFGAVDRKHFYVTMSRARRFLSRRVAYLANYRVLIGNVAAEETRTEEQFRGSDEGLYNWQCGKTRLRDMERAVVIYVPPVYPTNDPNEKNRF